jgi:hypothetical protein
MKYFAFILIILFVSCVSTRVSNIHPKKNNESLYKVYKIDSINSYYLIYAKMGKSIYKIVSKKEAFIGLNRIERNRYYYFKLHSSMTNRQIGNTVILPQNSLLVNCFSYDDTTQICLESGQIRDLYYADNIKGIFFILVE